MKEIEKDTPPSSINGDEITGMGEEGVMYLEEGEELNFDEEEMEEVIDINEEEEDIEMEPPEDHSLLVFNNHVGSVFCCDLHPNGKIAATGGEDDKAYVWNVDSGQIVMDCSGHKDSVVFVGFSHDGVYLATADMSGLVKVWKCNLDNSQTEPWSIVFEYEADDLLWGLWHFGTRVLFCGTVTGAIYLFKIPSGDTKVLPGHNVKSECGKLFPDGVRLASGYEDGSLKIWDLKTEKVVHHIEAATHGMRVTAIDTDPENNLIASISTDGKAVFTTSSNGKVVTQIETENDLEAVAYAQDPQLGFVALGTLNGSVTVWDVPRRLMRNHCSKSDDEAVVGVTKMFWVKHQLVTGCLDGSIRVYDGRNGNKFFVLTGHRSEILDMCYNSESNIILTTSDDGTARIFKYEISKEKE